MLYAVRIYNENVDTKNQTLLFYFLWVGKYFFLIIETFIVYLRIFLINLKTKAMKTASKLAQLARANQNKQEKVRDHGVQERT